jgi:hypothetical protein
MSAGTRPVWGRQSFRRIVDIPFGTCVATVESWQLTGQGGGPRWNSSHAGRSLAQYGAVLTITTPRAPTVR